MNFSPKWLWMRFWMKFSGPRGLGRLATRLATLAAPPYKDRTILAGLHPQGFVAPDAIVRGVDLRRGAYVYVGERVVLYARQGGRVELGDRSTIHRECIIEVGLGGNLHIGAHTHIQPRCQFACYQGSVHIGSHVQIAPYCAFYPYNHGIAPGKQVGEQPLHSKGGIHIEDDVTFGVGVTVLDGVRIGKGAVIGANSLVMHDVPAGAIALGVPARVVRMRDELAPYEDEAAAAASG